MIFPTHRPKVGEPCRMSSGVDIVHIHAEPKALPTHRVGDFLRVVAPLLSHLGKRAALDVSNARRVFQEKGVCFRAPHHVAGSHFDGKINQTVRISFHVLPGRVLVGEFVETHVVTCPRELSVFLHPSPPLLLGHVRRVDKQPQLCVLQPFGRLMLVNGVLRGFVFPRSCTSLRSQQE